MDERVKTVRMEKWLEVVMAQKASGLSITKWCENHGMRARQFHYWQKILRDHALLERRPDHNNSAAKAQDEEPVKELPAQVFAEVSVSAKQVSLKAEENSYSASYVQDSGIVIGCQDCLIHITDTFSERALARVLQVIRDA